jgi:hypothetical protein
MAALGRLFAWRPALRVVKPDTFIRWHRKGFRLFWRWKSRPRGRPRLPNNLRQLILRMAAENPIWGEARIADQLQLKLGLRVSPRTVGKYLAAARGPGRTPDPKHRWMTFVRNHAKGIVACAWRIRLAECCPSKNVVCLRITDRQSPAGAGITSHTSRLTCSLSFSKPASVQECAK